MENKSVKRPPLSAPFVLLAISLALGLFCMAISFAANILDFAIPLFQSPALLAVCIIMLGFYEDKFSAKSFIASFAFNCIYFSFSMALGNVASILPVICCIAMTVFASDKFSNRFSKVVALLGAFTSLISFAFVIILNFLPESVIAVLSELSPSEDIVLDGLAYIGYAGFGIVPVLFFSAIFIMLAKKKRNV